MQRPHPMTIAAIFVLSVSLLLSAIDGCRAYRADRPDPVNATP